MDNTIAGNMTAAIARMASMYRRYHVQPISVHRAGKSISQYRHVMAAYLTAFSLGLASVVGAQIATVAPNPVFTGFDNSGNECSSCKLYWYVCGSTTNLTVYTDAALTSAHTQPITLNSAGRPPSNVGIFLTPGVCHKAVLKTSADVELWAIDSIRPGGGLTVINSTSTGTQNAWAPGITGNTFIDWTGAGDLTLNGIDNAGVILGTVVVIRCNGSSKILANHASGSAAAGEQLVNYVSSGATPVANTGYAVYVYASSGGTNYWQLIGHEQGAWITPTFSAGDFSSDTGSWTVASEDVSTMAYRLSGRMLTVAYTLATTTVGGTPSLLVINGGQIGGFTHTKSIVNPSIVNDNAGGNVLGYAQTIATSTAIFLSEAVGPWATSNNATYLSGELTFEVN